MAPELAIFPVSTTAPKLDRIFVASGNESTVTDTKPNRTLYSRRHGLNWCIYFLTILDNRKNPACFYVPNSPAARRWRAIGEGRKRGSW